MASPDSAGPFPPEIYDEKLEELLSLKAPVVTDQFQQASDFLYIRRKLHRKAVTLLVFWQEYKLANPNG